MRLWNLPNISIAPERLFTLFGFEVTNTFLCTWLVIAVLFFVCYLGIRRQNLIPSGMQNAFEWIVEGLLGLVEGVAGKEKGRRFFPFVASFFIFILFANLLDVIPGVDTIGQIDPASHVHAGLLWGADSNKLTTWLRPPTTDLNLTLAMAFVSVIATQFFGFAILGPKEQLSKYFNFKALMRGRIIDFVVGLLEIVSELGRLISFSFRLFGNIFAGSVLLAVFAFLLPVVATIFFIPFEIFIGAIQAFVFGFLTLVFMEVGTISHSHAEHAESDTHKKVEEYEDIKATTTHV